MKTLIALNKNWIFWLDRAGIYTLPIGALLIPYLMLSLELSLLHCILGVLGTSFTLGVIHHYCLRHLVKCPKCGFNLTKFKDGTNIPPKHVYNALKAGRACLNCGWKPFEELEQKSESEQ